MGLRVYLFVSRPSRGVPFGRAEKEIPTPCDELKRVTDEGCMWIHTWKHLRHAYMLF